jgi:Flp pilus assembly pilin Flp
MCDALKRLWDDEDGLSTVEYVLLIILILIVGVTAWSVLDTSMPTKVDAGG